MGTEKRYTVYGLIEPHTHRIRYIGITCRKLGDRLAGHKHHAFTKRTHFYVAKWIRSIYEPKQKLLHTVLHSGLNEEAACEKEQELIELYNDLYPGQLTNTALGGKGVSVKEVSKEHRRRQSKAMKAAHKRNPELRKRTSETSKNNWQQEEYRENLIAHIKERWANPEYKSMMKKKRKESWTPERKKKQANRQAKTYEFINPQGEKQAITNLKQFCADNDLHWSCMKRVIKGDQKYHKGWKLP